MKVEQLINQRHALQKLAQRMDWQSCEEKFGALNADGGRSGILVRTMPGLHSRQHSFNESNEDVAALVGKSYLAR
jgi:IS5 family transposase